MWIPYTDVIKVVQDSLAGKWEWPFNSRCKYISIRIDMRDGHCILTDREGRII